MIRSSSGDTRGSNVRGAIGSWCRMASVKREANGSRKGRWPVHNALVVSFFQRGSHLHAQRENLFLRQGSARQPLR